MKTRVTELLNIEYPVIQGGMAWVADANLAAHVSKAGGMGFIGAANAPAEWVKEQIHIARKITDKPVGVNIMLLSDYADEIAQLVIDEHIEAVTTGAGNPKQIYEGLEGSWNKGYSCCGISCTCKNDGTCQEQMQL